MAKQQTTQSNQFLTDTVLSDRIRSNHPLQVHGIYLLLSLLRVGIKDGYFINSVKCPEHGGGRGNNGGGTRPDRPERGDIGGNREG